MEQVSKPCVVRTRCLARWGLSFQFATGALLSHDRWLYNCQALTKLWAHCHHRRQTHISLHILHQTVCIQAFSKFFECWWLLKFCVCAWSWLLKCVESLMLIVCSIMSVWGSSIFLNCWFFDLFHLKPPNIDPKLCANGKQQSDLLIVVWCVVCVCLHSLSVRVCIYIYIYIYIYRYIYIYMYIYIYI